MFNKLTISKRFSLILFLIFIVTLPLITSIMYYFFRQNAIREIADKATLTMHSMDSIRKYVGDELRPGIKREVAEKFMLEGMSGFYILRKISYNLQRAQPNYIYKQATNNPLAMENKADYYEEWLISRFRETPSAKELTGIRADGKESLYYIARPVIVDRQECMTCHGDPAAAPQVQVERYGTTSGYHYTMGSVVGTNIIYVPASVPIAIATKSTVVVAVVFTALFFLLFIIINILIRNSIIRPIENFVKAADQVSKGRFDNKFEVNTEDELKTLADSFTRLKTSIIMMMDMMKKTGK
jgi:methyl-accepting chemotaxis protein